MAKETYDFDFVTEVGGKYVLIQNQTPRDEKKEAEKLKAYAKGIADATGNNA